MMGAGAAAMAQGQKARWGSCHLNTEIRDWKEIRGAQGCSRDAQPRGAQPRGAQLRGAQLRGAQGMLSSGVLRDALVAQRTQIPSLAPTHL